MRQASPPGGIWGGPGLQTRPEAVATAVAGTGCAGSRQKHSNKYMTLQEEITRRRTFAVIAHPDAGKTTLTEKLLLFGGAHPRRRGGQKQQDQERRHVGLHGDRAPARHLGRHGRDGLRIQGHQDQHPRHPGPRGLRRRHLPHADGRRFGHHRHRRRQGRRVANPQTDGGVPYAFDAGDRLHQQTRPPLQGAFRPAGRGGKGTAHPRAAAGLPHFERPHVPRGLQPLRKEPLAFHVGRKTHRRRPDRRDFRPRVARSWTATSARNSPNSCARTSSWSKASTTSSTARPTCAASWPPCSSARRSTTSACANCSNASSASPPRRARRPPRPAPWSPPSRR